MADRTPRQMETREATKERDTWRPASLLPVPYPQKGVKFRWIRVSTLGTQDAKNVSSRMREGWVPVRAEDHPELEVQSDVNSQFKGGVEVGGLLLCKTSTENIAERENYYSRRAKDQLKSVDHHYLRESDPRMPLSKPERRTRVSFGTGEDQS